MSSRHRGADGAKQKYWGSEAASNEILAVLRANGPLSIIQIAQKVGRSVDSVDHQVLAMHRATAKRVYIHAYQRALGRGRNPRIWAAGDEEDADPRIEDETKPVLSEEEIEAEERRQALAQIRVFRDPFVVALFGEAA
jgi:hypothetical protein